MTNNFAFLKRIFLFEQTWQTSFSGSTENLAKNLIEDLPDLNFYKSKLLISSEYQKIDNLHEKIELEFVNATDFKIGEITIMLISVNNLWEVEITKIHSPGYIFFLISSGVSFMISIYWVKTTFPKVLFFTGGLLFLFSVIAFLIESRRLSAILTKYVLSKFDYVEK